MLDFLKALSELASLDRLPWRWWVGLSLGIAGMIAILMHVEGEIAVLYIFLELILAIGLTAGWQWRAERNAQRAGARR